MEPSLPDFTLDSPIPYDLPDGTVGCAYLHRNDKQDAYHKHLQEPLNTRAWTFQGQIFSSRVVIYHHDQISWDCWSTSINLNGPLNPILWSTQDSPGQYFDSPELAT